MQDLAAKAMTRRFGLPTSAIRALERSGHIQKAGAKYSLRDLLVLKIAGALSAAGITFNKIDAALANITPSLPGAAITALPVQTPEMTVFEAQFRTHPAKHPVALAQRHFEKALALEDVDPDGARAAYLKSLEADAHHVEARINLGRLLHLKGDHGAAEAVYRDGLTANALLSFNLALLMEDLERESEAILAYREALLHDPQLADAHFNLARLHERAGRKKAAFRHLLAFRRLTQVPAGRKRAKRRRRTKS